jgi:hypothetical protein
LIAVSCALLLSACGLFDYGIEWRSGPYGLVWVDLPSEVSLSYDMGSGSWATIVEPCVFAVGANQEYIVAKQHPGGNKSITNYFIVNIRAGAPKADWKEGVIGPLAEKDFEERSATMKLPAFTKTLESLR